MQTYRLDLKYIGTDFEGWQSQPQATGIQDHLEKALATFLRHPVRVKAAARTDSGVHAERQVAIFKTSEPFEELRWMRSLHGLLPLSVGVTAVAPVDDAFHPIYSAKGKAYRYRIWQGSTRNPHITPFSWQVHRHLDVAAMRAEAPSLVGTHDFTSFCAPDSSAKTRRRTVLEVDVIETGPLVDIWVIGHGFLKQMVRIMVGTLVDVGFAKRPPGSATTALLAKDRKSAGRTAPANGLSLVEIFYDEIIPAAALRQQLSAEYCVRIQ